MKAIILAAGVGNRMQPLTARLPKTLLRINNTTIIEQIINGLIENGVRDILVVTGHCGDMLQDFLKKQYPDTVFTFVHNSRYSETNNIFSLSLAMNELKIDDSVLIIESDLFFEPAVLKKIIHSGYANVALVDKFKTGMDGTVVTVSNRIITNIIPIQLQDENFDFSDKYKTLNIYKFSKEFCEKSFKKLLNYYARVIDDNIYYEIILGILIYLQKEVIHAEFIDKELWAEVDDPNDLNVAEFLFNKPARIDILDYSFGGFWNYGITDFAFIRNMYFPNSSMISEIKHNFTSLLTDYCSRQEILNEKLSFFLMCDKDRVHLLNGASQIFPLFWQIFAGKRALLPSPTFGEFPRVFPLHDTYSDKPGITISEIESKKGRNDIIVFVNPNNPTGTVLEGEYIIRFAKENPQKIVIVDESFIDFSEKKPVLSLLHNQPVKNVILIKSLSKSLGVPGLRMGFVFSFDDEFNRIVREFLPIWNTNSFAEFFLEILLKHRRSLQDSYKLTIRDRNSFTEQFSNQSWIKKVHPSAANFFLIELENLQKNQNLQRWLLEQHSTYIKNVSDKFESRNCYYRIPIRSPEENKKLIRCMGAFFNQ